MTEYVHRYRPSPMTGKPKSGSRRISEHAIRTLLNWSHSGTPWTEMSKAAGVSTYTLKSACDGKYVLSQSWDRIMAYIDMRGAQKT